MRKQYHFRESPEGLLAWDIHRLVELTCDTTPEEIPLSEIEELDRTFWYDLEGDSPTCRSVALHAKLIQEVDLAHPIIISRDGRVMDGMHRVCRALIEGRTTIMAVRLDHDPQPDYVGVRPEELPYD